MDGDRLRPLLTARRVRIALLLALALAACGSDRAEARVFRRWGAAGTGIPDEWLGGRTAYQTTVRVNGGQGALWVSGWDEDFAVVVDRLKTTWFAGREDRLAVGDGLAFGMLREENRVSRVLVAGIGAGCITFRLDQSEAEFRRSRGPPAGRSLRGLPAYPGSAPVFFAANEQTGTGCEILRAQADAWVIRDQLDGQLRREGWKAQGVKAAPTPGPVGLTVYTRGPETCGLLVRRVAGGGESLISLLYHRRPSGTAGEGR